MNCKLALLGLSFLALTFAPGHRAVAPSGQTAQTAAAIPFADFDAQVEIEDLEFEVRGNFTLGPNSDGINLFKEDVSFEVGTFSKTIPAGSFKQEERGKIRYKESTQQLDLDILIRVAGSNKYTIKIEGEGMKLPGKPGAKDVLLRIGNDEGRAREMTK
jgi:hypothetical protein